MKKFLFAIVAAFSICLSTKAIKPIQTEGFDLYGNSIKIDLVSLGFVAPQLQWEHFTDTRFSYGIYAQAHFVNRSTLRDLDKSPGKKVADDGETYDTKWDRRYKGVMICPEGRFYVGNKPARGFYLAARADAGIFRALGHTARDGFILLRGDGPIQRQDHAEARFSGLVLAGRVNSRGTAQRAHSGAHGLRAVLPDRVQVQGDQVAPGHVGGLASAAAERTAHESADILQLILLGLRHAHIGLMTLGAPDRRSQALAQRGPGGLGRRPVS